MAQPVRKKWRSGNDGIGQMLICCRAAAFPPTRPAAGSPSLSLAPPAPGPARPKHPDGERLFPYQSGNTAPPPHPLYKKHDSSIPRYLLHTPHTPTPPRKMQEEQPDSRICQKPLNSFYRAKKEKGKIKRTESGGTVVAAVAVWRKLGVRV